MRELRKEDCCKDTDSSRVRYVCKVKDELTKNRRENDEAQETQTMFETGGGLCPVRSFEKYLCHLNPKNVFLFQRPKKAVKDSDKVWFDNVVVGQRSLADKIKNLSAAAELSYPYTNHSIRATAIIILHDCGFEAQHIMTLSGHKSESSIRSYAARTSLSTKRKMSETISRSLNNNQQMALVSEAEMSSSSAVGSEETTFSAAQAEPLLTTSQEKFILDNEMSIQNSQQTVNNFYNCTFNFAGK